MDRLIIDINKGIISPNNTYATQTDNKCRTIPVTIVNGDARVNLTNKIVRLAAINKDKLKSITIITVTNPIQGEFNINLEGALVSKEGTINMQLGIFDDSGYLMHTCQFTQYINQSLFEIIAPSMQESNEFKEVLDGLKKIQDWDNYFKDITPNLEEKYTTRLNDLNTNVNQVKSQLDEIVIDDTFKNNSFLSTMASWIGIMNKGYMGDNGTRVYILPKDKVTTGLGGAIKIFADAYQNDSINYRDLGIYFHQNQNNDTGHNGAGVNWINVKVNGTYATKYPDIGFSFQDGAYVGGRFIKSQYGVLFIVGDRSTQMLNLDTGLKFECQGNIGLPNNASIKWMSPDGTNVHNWMTLGSDGYFKFNANGGMKINCNNAQKFVITEEFMRLDSVAMLKNSTVTCTDTSVPYVSVKNANRLIFNQSTVKNMTGLSGNNGQTLTILFMNGNTTLINGSSIKLQGGVNFTGGENDTLTLENINNIWYEISRSINHA